MQALQYGVASGVIVNISGPGGLELTYATVLIDDDQSLVCAELPPLPKEDKNYDLSIGANVVVSYEDDGYDRIIDCYDKDRYDAILSKSKKVNQQGS